MVEKKRINWNFITENECPIVPENCSRFKFIPYKGHYFMTEIGVWIPISDLFDIAGTDFDPDNSAMRTIMDLCSIARCNWLDAAKEEKKDWYWTNQQHFACSLALKLQNKKSTYPQCYNWEKIYTYYLACAEAWERISDLFKKT